jgi:hypothetical protein
MPSVPWRTVAQPRPDGQYLVMASRLPLRSYRSIPRFMALTASVVAQLERTTGVTGYSLGAQPMSRTFSTLSAWTGQADLDEFVRTLPHLSVMARRRPHMGATRFTTWTVPGTLLPIPWPQAAERLMGPTATNPHASRR